MKKLLIFPIFLLIVGCASSSHVVTGKIHPAISPDAVRIYSTKPAGAEEVAILTGVAHSVNIQYSVDAMKKDAAKLGANGIYIDRAISSLRIGSSVSGTALYVP